MAYNDGEIVLANDYNSRKDTVNNIWSTGSGNFGWGQSALSSVTVGSIVQAGLIGSSVEWAKMIDTVNNMNLHAFNASAGLAVPQKTDIITFLSSFDTTVSNISTNRYGTYYAFDDQSVVSGSHTATWGGGGASITNTATVTWPTADAARYFFNAGGRVNLSLAYSGGSGSPQDSNWATVVSAAGTMWVQAESSGGTATNTGRGYWQSGGVLYSGAGTVPYASNTLVVSVSGNGGTSLTFTTVFTDNHTNIWYPAFPTSDQVTGTFTVSVLVRKPTTNGLTTNTWGLASVSVPNF
jgi:hypothetical protein